jgi:hypothetical protein
MTEFKRAGEFLSGGLLAAFTTAVATSIAGGAHATTFINTTLTTPVSFDLLSTTPSSSDFTIGNQTFTVSQSQNPTSGAYSIDLDTVPANTVVGVPILLADGLGSPNDIGSYWSYQNNGMTPLKTLTGGATIAENIGTPGSTATTALGNGSGYIGLFFGPSELPAYISYDNVISINSDNVGDDLFTVTGYGVAVPEPETWALLVLGVAATGAALRRRRRTAEAVA